MKYVLSIGFIFFTILGYSQNWKVLNDDYTYVYDISAHDSTLYITGLKDGHFIFASSEDHGVTWNEIILDEDITVELGIPICVGFFNTEEGIIGIKGNFTREYLRTTDGGANWEPYTPNLDEGCGNVPQPFKIVVIDDSIAVVAQFQSGDYIITRDKGVSWACESRFSISWLHNFTAINKNTFFNFDLNGLYKSLDGGTSWNPVLDVADLATYRMLDEESGFAAGAWYGNADGNPILYATTDGWNTFEATPLPALNDKLINAIVPVSADALFLVETENIHFSDDAGQTVSLFQALDFESTSAVKIDHDWYLTGRGLARYNTDDLVNNSELTAHGEDTVIYPNPVTGSRIKVSNGAFTEYQLSTLDGHLVETGPVKDETIQLKSGVKGLHILSIWDRNKRIRQVTRVMLH